MIERATHDHCLIAEGKQRIIMQKSVILQLCTVQHQVTNESFEINSSL